MYAVSYAGLLVLLSWVTSIFLTTGSSQSPGYANTRQNTNVLVRGLEATGAQGIELFRRATPPITTIPQCDEYDGYFYLTPANYTWQLQCTTNYEGNIIFQGDTTNFSQCIGACTDYNGATAPGTCLAITFNGPNIGAVGLCTLWSDIFNVLLASEEGNVQDSALLIFGPSGEAYATPQADPSFSGAPTQPPPTIDPLPTASTSGSVISTVSTSTTASTLPTILTDLTLTTTSTLQVYISSCDIGVPDCLEASSTSLTFLPASTTSQISTTTSTISSLYITDGGSRPATPIKTSSVTITQAALTPGPTTTSDGLVVDPIQTTFKEVVFFTEYRIQTIELCTPKITPCAQSISTVTVVGSRTEISCSPGSCSDLVLVTSLTADVTATGSCSRI